MHVGVSPFQETSWGRKEKPAQMEFGHNQVLQKCLWAGLSAFFRKSKGQGLLVVATAAAGHAQGSARCAPITSVPQSSGVGPASCSCLQFVFAGTRLHPATGLPPTCVLPSAWRSNWFYDTLCKIRLNWWVHLIISHLKTATALTDRGLFPGWESPAFCVLLGSEAPSA